LVDFIGEALITGITSASIVVSTKTVTTGAAHGLVAGDVVKIASAAGPALDDQLLMVFISLILYH
jgi:hypothetical protein